MRQALRTAVDEVLERMFFAETLGECAACDAECASGEKLAVSLTFAGEPSGFLLLHMSAMAARQIAADFLGADEASVSALQTSEVVCELANMICGSVLSRVESATTFQLGAPHVVATSVEAMANSGGTRYCVQLTNGRLAVHFGTGSPICPPPVLSAF
jgi:CheY-specific phosphatase CheX